MNIQKKLICFYNKIISESMMEIMILARLIKDVQGIWKRPKYVDKTTKKLLEND